jgi:hypothetical protein
VPCDVRMIRNPTYVIIDHSLSWNPMRNKHTQILTKDFTI